MQDDIQPRVAQAPHDLFTTKRGQGGGAAKVQDGVHGGDKK